MIGSRLTVPIVSQVVLNSDSDIICPEYRRLPGGDRRCQHYVGNGSCGLEGAILCVEWVRKTPDQHEPGTLERMLSLVRSSGSVPSPAVPAVPAAPAEPAEPAAPPTETAQAARTLASRPGLPVAGGDWVPTREQVESLASRGYELELQTEAGDVVLVPKYTSLDRVELTYEDARTLASIASVFPGTKLRRVRR